MTAFFAVKFAAAVTLICAALFAPGCAQGLSNNLQAIDTTSRNCGENQFACRNGECIQSELLCDGRADCSDQSDETQVECTKPELTCPDYTFRCTYGACVNGDATCNGVRDCIDNSDETLPKCPGKSAADPNESCGTDDYRCQDGQCIASTSLCDGTVDCTDGSDETFINCGSFPCSQLAFRCNYGACIDGDLKCNNVSNCADGSDENAILCGRPGPGPSVSPLPTPTPTPTPTPRPIPTPSRSCLVPPQPMNGQWKLDKSLCGAYGDGNTDCDIPQGVELEPGNKLIYSCNPGYKVRGNVEVYCGTGGKWAALPVCIEIRCKVLNSPSTAAECTIGRSNDYISCANPVPPGTRAVVRCRAGYRKDTNFIANQRDLVDCSSSGIWEPNPTECVPVCGKEIAHQTPLVINGTLAKLGDFPWHATLYVEKNTEAGVRKEFQCGGTIIQTNLIMTAAHCIFDETIQRTFDPSKLFVMTGTTFRDYDSPFHNPVTVRKEAVKSIHRRCDYYGLQGNYDSDIALLELHQAFKLSTILLPACLDLGGDSAHILETGAYGRVAGFGRTSTGPSSSVLQTLTVPYVSYTDCINSEQGVQNKFLINRDKFCAGYTNGSAVCEGDSGGGLVFKNGDLWYVMGVVSVGLGADISGGERICSSHSYSLYTRVATYMAWIQKIILDLDRFKELPPCDN